MSCNAASRHMIAAWQTSAIDKTSMPIIHTARLDLHPVQKRDVDLLHNMWVDAEIRRYLWDGVVIDRSMAERVIEDGVGLWQRENYGLWVIYEKSSKSAIGFAGFRATGEPDVPEILFGLLPSAWGNGYATEAARAALEYMRARGGVAAIHAEADEPNVASIRVLERLGMSRTGVRTGENGTVITFRRMCDEVNTDVV